MGYECIQTYETHSFMGTIFYSIYFIGISLAMKTSTSFHGYVHFQQCTVKTEVSSGHQNVLIRTPLSQMVSILGHLGVLRTFSQCDLYYQTTGWKNLGCMKDKTLAKFQAIGCRRSSQTYLVIIRSGTRLRRKFPKQLASYSCRSYTTNNLYF